MMELINRDDVMAILKDEIYTEECEFDDGDCVVCWVVDDKDAVIEKIKRLPTYESRPKGKWIDNGQVREIGGYSADCSVCGEWSEYLTNFCGNCGADMRDGK